MEANGDRLLARQIPLGNDGENGPSAFEDSLALKTGPAQNTDTNALAISPLHWGSETSPASPALGSDRNNSKNLRLSAERLALLLRSADSFTQGSEG